MENKTDKTLDILRVIRGPKDQVGLKIVRVNTAEPAPITLVFEGTPLPLDLEIFEIPVSCYPLRKDDRLLAFPLVGNDNGQRWAAITKLNGGVVMATMTGATSCQVEGIGRQYVSQDLIIPPYFLVGNTKTRYTDNDVDLHCNGGDSGTSTDNYTAYSDYYLLPENSRPLQAGDVVSLAPTYKVEGGVTKIKYVILERY